MVLKGLIFNNFLFVRMFLKRFLTISTLSGCYDLQRTDFLVSTLEDVAGLLLNILTLRGCGGPEWTDFQYFSFWDNVGS